jgi:hypothetical protein
MKQLHIAKSRLNDTDPVGWFNNPNSAIICDSPTMAVHQPERPGDKPTISTIDGSIPIQHDRIARLFVHIMIPYVVYLELSEHPGGKATLYQRIFYPAQPAMRDVVPAMF